MAAVQSVLKVLMVTVVGTGVVSLSMASSAQAGFGWTPPAKAEAPVQPGVAPAEAAPIDPNLLTPEPATPAPVAPVEGSALKAEDLVAPVPTEAPVVAEPTPVAAAPVETAPTGMKTISAREGAATESAAPGPRRVREEIQWGAADQSAVKKELETAPVAAEPASAPTPILTTDTVQGFAKDISLALALSQVVPPNYAYKFADGVNPGQKVSWQGGKPWPQVLSDMLVANNLQVVIIENTVTVQPVAGAPVAAASEAPAVPAEDVKAEAAPEAPVESEAKVARLSSSETAEDLPVPVRSVSLSDKSEAQAVEATEREAASEEPVPVTPVVAAPSLGKDVPVVDIQTSRRWQASPGKTLRETLEGWSATAGAEVEWMSPYDYPVDHAFVYEGKFDAAVDSLLSLYSREQQRPRGKLYPNLPTGPSVLMVN